MNAQTEHILDFDELLAIEEASFIRHQCVDGRLYPMFGGPIDHTHVLTNLITAVHSRLRGIGCCGAGIQQRVRTSETATNWYYPDFLIKCPPYRFHTRDKNALLNPHTIFEVLSPATAEFDHTDKFDEYARIVELSDYVLVSSDRVRVEHFHRGQNGEWIYCAYRTLAQELRLDLFGISVPLGEIYEDVEISEQSVLPGMEANEALSF